MLSYVDQIEELSAKIESYQGEVEELNEKLRLESIKYIESNSAIKESLLKDFENQKVEIKTSVEKQLNESNLAKFKDIQEKYESQMRLNKESYLKELEVLQSKLSDMSSELLKARNSANEYQQIAKVEKDNNSLILQQIKDIRLPIYYF